MSRQQSNDDYEDYYLDNYERDTDNLFNNRIPDDDYIGDPYLFDAIDKLVDKFDKLTTPYPKDLPAWSIPPNIDKRGGVVGIKKNLEREKQLQENINLMHKYFYSLPEPRSRWYSDSRYGSGRYWDTKRKIDLLKERIPKLIEMEKKILEVYKIEKGIVGGRRKKKTRKKRGGKRRKKTRKKRGGISERIEGELMIEKDEFYDLFEEVDVETLEESQKGGADPNQIIQNIENKMNDIVVEPQDPLTNILGAPPETPVPPAAPAPMDIIEDDDEDDAGVPQRQFSPGDEVIFEGNRYRILRVDGINNNGVREYSIVPIDTNTDPMMAPRDARENELTLATATPEPPIWQQHLLMTPAQQAWLEEEQQGGGRRKKKTRKKRGGNNVITDEMRRRWADHLARDAQIEAAWVNLLPNIWTNEEMLKEKLGEWQMLNAKKLKIYKEQKKLVDDGNQEARTLAAETLRRIRDIEVIIHYLALDIQTLVDHDADPAREGGGKRRKKKTRRKPIRINPKMRGVFTKKAKRKGMSVQKYAKYIVKKYKGKKKTKRQLKLFRQALFAKTAKKWKKKKTRKKRGGFIDEVRLNCINIIMKNLTLAQPRFNMEQIRAIAKLMEYVKNKDNSLPKESVKVIDDYFNVQQDPDRFTIEGVKQIIDALKRMNKRTPTESTRRTNVSGTIRSITPRGNFTHSSTSPFRGGKSKKKTRKKRGGADTPVTYFVVRARQNYIIDFLNDIRARQNTNGYFLENDNDIYLDRVDIFIQSLEEMMEEYGGGYFLITYNATNPNNFIGGSGGRGYFNYQHTNNIPQLQQFIANHMVPQQNIFPPAPIDLFTVENTLNTLNTGNDSPRSITQIFNRGGRKKKTRKKRGGVYTQKQKEAMMRKINRLTRKKNIKFNILINGITNKTLSESEIYNLAAEVSNMIESIKIHWRGLLAMQQQNEAPRFLSPTKYKKKRKLRT